MPDRTDDAGAPRRTYGVKEQHRNSWGWKVSAYLWTKSIAAGRVPGAGAPRPWPTLAGAGAAAAPLVARSGFLAAHRRAAGVRTCASRARFLWTLTRPQWRSWLTRGSYVIAAYGAAARRCTCAGRLAGRPVPRLLDRRSPRCSPPAPRVYTAFLFGQAKGRDLWQSPLLAPAPARAGPRWPAPRSSRPSWLLWLLPVNGLLVAGEVWGRHATEDARRAARLIQEDRALQHRRAGRWATCCRWPCCGRRRPRGLLAGALALLGLLLWEHLYVQAPQRIPLA